MSAGLLLLAGCSRWFTSGQPDTVPGATPDLVPVAAPAAPGGGVSFSDVGPRGGPDRRANRLPEPLADSRTVLVPFGAAPFPYDGTVPDTGRPFLDVRSGGRRGHSAPRGGVKWLDETYSDNRALLFLPRGLDLRRPVSIVVFLHGNLSTLERDVAARQQVPRQVEQSGLNAVLVAPQLAVDAADSSAGGFWQPGAFGRFLDEAADRLADAAGSPAARRVFARAPVILVAYSGGYNPAAYSLLGGGAENRLRGVVLLDALYGEVTRFAEWIEQRRSRTFFVSTYSASSAAENHALQARLAEKRIPFQLALPPSLDPGTVAFVSAGGNVVHGDFVTRAWVPDPLRVILSRVGR